ncbi:MAG: hypothetical protein HYU66_11170 [Armatimonadetes bacterium]|nr:hypothetical protein [Armatimonadota bacterium]
MGDLRYGWFVIPFGLTDDARVCQYIDLPLCDMAPAVHTAVVHRSRPNTAWPRPSLNRPLCFQDWALLNPVATDERHVTVVARLLGMCQTERERLLLDLYLEAAQLGVQERVDRLAAEWGLPDEPGERTRHLLHWQLHSWARVCIPMPQAGLTIRDVSGNEQLRIADFAFWTGDDLYAVEVAGGHRDSAANLSDKIHEYELAGIKLLHVSGEELSRSGTDALIRILPPILQRPCEEPRWPAAEETDEEES